MPCNSITIKIYLKIFAHERRGDCHGVYLHGMQAHNTAEAERSGEMLAVREVHTLQDAQQEEPYPDAGDMTVVLIAQHILIAY